MRKLLAAVSAAVLALAMTVPIASAAGAPSITDIHITQVTLDQKTGELHIVGYAFCSNLEYSWLDAQGQVRQAIGRKTSIPGGVWGGVACVPNGPATLDLFSTADWGTFGTGWASIQFQLGFNGCNEFGCFFNPINGIDWTVIKIVKK
ncbi:MAG TPA: hypothetical protein VET90_02025 [Candidatus Binatus sp.]|nr:hypothetical protein [Candidatus Binatus sp.]